MPAWRFALLPALGLLAMLVGCAEAIVCYQCDALNKPVSDCPGWHRRPIDTFIDKNDRGGLFSHCVEIRLRNGTIVHQDAYPDSPTCNADFKDIWRQTLENRFQQRVSVRCCESNMCNGPNGRAGGRGTDAHGLAMLALTASVACLLR
jgi:hypothetical protein